MLSFDALSSSPRAPASRPVQHPLAKKLPFPHSVIVISPAWLQPFVISFQSPHLYTTSQLHSTTHSIAQEFSHYGLLSSSHGSTYPARSVQSDLTEPSTYGLVLLNPVPPATVIRVIVMSYLPQETMGITPMRAATHHSALRQVIVALRPINPGWAANISRLATLKEEVEDTLTPSFCPHEKRKNYPPPISHKRPSSGCLFGYG